MKDIFECPMPNAEYEIEGAFDSRMQNPECKILTENRWQEIRQRLDANRAALEQGFEPNQEEKDRTLKTRAEALAKKEKKAHEGETYLEVVEFMLAHERYALELTYIREVHPLKEFTPLPGTPPFVLGIINFRGEIISIIDLKKIFELPDQGLTDLNRVIILNSGEMEFGILADTILGVNTIPTGTIQPTLPTLTGVRAEYLKGITGDRVVVLDGGKILSDPKMVVQIDI